MQAEKEFFDHLAAGRFMLPRGPKGCFFPPRAAAPGSGASWEWVPASGRGKVYSVTVVQPKPPQPPYNVALVDLEEGGRMMSRVEGCAPEEVVIGMPVQARVVAGESGLAVVFVPREVGAA